MLPTNRLCWKLPVDSAEKRHWMLSVEKIHTWTWIWTRIWTRTWTQTPPWTWTWTFTLTSWNDILQKKLKVLKEYDFKISTIISILPLHRLWKICFWALMLFFFLTWAFFHLFGILEMKINPKINPLINGQRRDVSMHKRGCAQLCFSGENNFVLHFWQETMNPGYQYLFQSLTTRALQGGLGRPLPAVPAHLSACLEPPPASLAAAGPVLDRIRELFPLEEVVASKAAGKRTGQSVFGTQEPAAGTENEEVPVQEVPFECYCVEYHFGRARVLEIILR